MCVYKACCEIIRFFDYIHPNNSSICFHYNFYIRVIFPLMYNIKLYFSLCGFKRIYMLIVVSARKKSDMCLSWIPLTLHSLWLTSEVFIYYRGTIFTKSISLVQIAKICAVTRSTANIEMLMHLYSFITLPQPFFPIMQDIIRFIMPRYSEALNYFTILKAYNVFHSTTQNYISRYHQASE